MKTLMLLLMFLVVFLATAFLTYCLLNLFVFLGQVLGGFHPRGIIEKKSYDWLLANRRSKFDTIFIAATDAHYSSLEIASMFGGGNVLLGSLYLLAANHMKKTSPP